MQDGQEKLRVAELFAGCGGFRLGLETKTDGSPNPDSPFRVTWSNQFEPGTKRQHASDVYVARFGGDGHSNEDIRSIVDDDARFNAVRAANPDVLVAGFPCQDYSVARPLNQAAGLNGEKGALWWAIHRFLQRRIEDGSPVKYLVLENVDRLLKSPSGCRGRDFAIILHSLADLNYDAEWRVINAADYGHPQRRKRVYIVAHHHSSPLWVTFSRAFNFVHPERWCTWDGVLAQAFPVQQDVVRAPRRFSIGPEGTRYTFECNGEGPVDFKNAGIMTRTTVWTANLAPALIDDYAAFTGHKHPLTLGDIVAGTKSVSSDYFIPDEQLAKWSLQKGAKRLQRVGRDGFNFTYSEGAVSFPDPLDRPSRTVITSEGGTGASRTKHVIRTPDDKLRRLTPEELESLMGFPRGHTISADVSPTRRAFLMGNALVVGIARRIGEVLSLAHLASDAKRGGNRIDGGMHPPGQAPFSGLHAKKRWLVDQGSQPNYSISPCRDVNIRTASDLQVYTGQCTQQGQLSLDTAELPLRADQLHDAQTVGVEIGLIDKDGVDFLVLRMQIGTHHVVWLADPHDERVWTMFERWEKHGAAEFGLMLAGEEERLPLQVPGIAFFDRREEFLEVSVDADPLQYVSAAMNLSVSPALRQVISGRLRECEVTHIHPLLLESPKVESGMAQLQVPTSMSFVVESVRNPVTH